MRDQARFDLYKGTYQHQIDMREQIESRIVSISPLVVIVAAVAGYLVKGTLLAKAFNYPLIFWLLLAVSGAALIFAIFFYCRAIWGYKYLLMPTATTLDGYYQEILKNNFLVSPGDARRWANESFDEYLFDAYMKYATRNAQNNDTKRLNLHYCIGSLIISFISGCFAYLPFYFIELN